jgi:hypothetical protein
MAQLDIKNCFTYAYSAGTFTDFLQTFTAGALSTNYIDLKVAGIRISGATKPPWLIVRVGPANFAGNTGGAQIKLICDSVIPVFDAATATDVVVYRFAMAVMVANALLVNQPLPFFDYKRYLSIEFEPHTADASAGQLIAYLSDGPEEGITAPAQTVTDGFS